MIDRGGDADAGSPMRPRRDECRRFVGDVNGP
jgi:hypothetical protein